MIQTRREFLDEFLDFVGHSSDTGARNTAETMLNRVLQTIAGKRAWRVLLFPTPYQFSTIANTRGYSLPPYFGRVSGIDGKIRDITTGTQLFPRNREDIEDEDPTVWTSLEVPARPLFYYLAGTQPVHTQPTMEDTLNDYEDLEVKSSSALDTTVRVEIAGIDDANRWTRTQVTLTGTATVYIGAWKEIHEFAKSYPEGTTPTTELTSSEGEVTLRTVTGGGGATSKERGKLLPWESAREYQVLSLYPVPDGVYTIAVPFIRAMQKTFKDADTIPADWGPACFEELHIEWMVNTGELTRAAAAQTPRPALLDLICLENAAAAQQQRQRTPFQG